MVHFAKGPFHRDIVEMSVSGIESVLLVLSMFWEGDVNISCQITIVCIIIVYHHPTWTGRVAAGVDWEKA